MLSFASTLLGLVVGSFLNVVINRTKLGEGLNGRSHCPHCKHTLGVLDLVPVLSYLWLRGKCRYCGGPISWQYPAVEILTSASFLLLAMKFGAFVPMLLLSWILVGFYIVIAVYDLKHFLILDKIVFPGIAVAVLYQLVRVAQGDCVLDWCSPLVGGILGALLISGFFWLQHLVSGGKWIGFGDVKFGLMLGMAAGFPNSVLLLFLAYMSGAVLGVALISMGKKEMGSKLPFGTFLSFAAILTLLYGDAIMKWYTNLIGL
jgi:prepilin signal peptidase PulO-like enzyme (type II secretory pathway)